MKIIIDNREQKPLDFKLGTLRATLNVGDYGAEMENGYVLPIVFERKGISDLFGSLSKGYERFRREILRAKEQDIHLIIIIEGSLRRVLSGCSNSMRTPISIVYQLFTIKVRYGVDIVFCNTREEIQEYITHYFLAEEREHNDTKSPEVRKPLS